LIFSCKHIDSIEICELKRLKLILYCRLVVHRSSHRKNELSFYHLALSALAAAASLAAAAVSLVEAAAVSIAAAAAPEFLCECGKGCEYTTVESHKTVAFSIVFTTENSDSFIVPVYSVKLTYLLSSLPNKTFT